MGLRAVLLRTGQEQPASAEVGTGGDHRLGQAGADALARHLDETERGHLGDLMLRPVATEAFDETAHDEVAIGFEDHVDEVDDDDAADVAQAQLADDLLGGFEVVPRHGLLEVAAGTGELSGVDVDDRHRLGAVDDERTARGQVDGAVERLLDLLLDPVVVEDPIVLGVPVDPVEEVGGDGFDVLVDGVPRAVAVDDERVEVLVEDVADDAHDHVRLAVEQLRGEHLRRLRLLLDGLPPLRQAFDVPAEFLVGRAFGCGADDDAVGVADELFEQLLQAGAFDVGQLAGDAGHRVPGHVDEEASRQGDLTRQTGALVPDRILRHLDEDGVAGAERRLDPAGLAVHAEGVPVDLTGVEHGVAALADVDERRLHAREHVLDLAEVDVADERGLLAVLLEIVLDGDAVLDDDELGLVAALAHEHRAIDGLAAGEELGFGDDRATASGLTALLAALTLGLEAGRALERGDLVAVGPARAGTATAATARTAVLVIVVGVAGPVLRRVLIRLGLLGPLRLLGLLTLGALLRPAATTLRPGGTLVLILGLLGLSVVTGVGVIVAAARAASAAAAATAPSAGLGVLVPVAAVVVAAVIVAAVVVVA
ncbi:Uncharacterised protein [Mycobacteroides abscessus subsp. abscessus]|nr:Uncharacterised protein [Mycobacteroides abscessus subsp. abscessus]